MARINIIIVNWNTGTFLKKCLLSLLDISHRKLIDQVIIVDNNSSDSSVKQAKYAITGAPFSIQFLHLRSNVGFAAANNLGIRRLKQTARSSSHFLLLNPDTELIPQSLSILTTVLEANPDSGIVGPKILNPDGTLQPSVRNLPTLSSFIWQLLKVHKIMPQAKLWRAYLQSDFDYSRQQEVEQIMGAAFLIRRRLLDNQGLLDERFWIWFEEVDYCHRALDAGFKIIYTPKAQIIHHGAVSFNQLSGFKKTKPWLLSSLKYAYKHLPPLPSLIITMIIPLAIILVIPATLHQIFLKNSSS